VAKTKTSKINCGEPEEIKTLEPRERRDEGRDSSVKKFAGKQRRKDNQAFFMAVWGPERKKTRGRDFGKRSRGETAGLIVKHCILDDEFLLRVV